MEYLFCAVILNFFIITGALLRRDMPVVETVRYIELEPVAETEPVPAERKQYALPASGMTVPGTKTYSQSSRGKIRSSSSLKSYYFKCIVLSEIVSDGKVYYLIRLNEPSVRSDVFIVSDKGVFILEPLQAR